MNTNDVILELRKMQTYNYTIADDEVFDQAVEALEKQIPKKVLIQRFINREYEVCPCCWSYRIFGNYCTGCGQKIFRDRKGE